METNPAEFLNTVYLGDRACKSIYIDCWKKLVAIQVDEISRVRSASGNWEFYTDEDIVDGSIVFTGVESINFEPSGPIPNDYINGIWARRSDGVHDQLWVFEVSISSGAGDGTSTEVILKIVGLDVHLEDPKSPGVRVRE